MSYFCERLFYCHELCLCSEITALGVTANMIYFMITAVIMLIMSLFVNISSPPSKCVWVNMGIFCVTNKTREVSFTEYILLKKRVFIWI